MGRCVRVGEGTVLLAIVVYIDGSFIKHSIPVKPVCRFIGLSKLVYQAQHTCKAGIFFSEIDEDNPRYPRVSSIAA